MRIWIFLGLVTVTVIFFVVLIFTSSNPLPLKMISPISNEILGRSEISSITLTAQKISSESARLLWTIDGQTSNSFIVLQSSASAPLYPLRPGDQVNFASGSATREFISKNLTGPVHFRICEFIKNSCGVYSNQISLEF